MKARNLYFLILFFTLSSFIICLTSMNKGWIRKSIGRSWKGGFKKVSASAAALILKRLGDNRSYNDIKENILKNCVHFRFLGRKLTKKFKINRKIKKNKSLRSNFSLGFVRYVLKSLIGCEIIRKSNVAYKIKKVLRNDRVGKHKCIFKKALALVKIFKGPVLKLRKNRSKPGYAKFRKGKSSLFKKRKINKNKKVKRATKEAKNLTNLLKRLSNFQHKCRSIGFKKGSTACKRANRLSRKYIRKASRVLKILNKSCLRYKKRCFKYRISCSEMFKECKKSDKVTTGLKNQKAIYFARVFTSIITHLNN